MNKKQSPISEMLKWANKGLENSKKDTNHALKAVMLPMYQAFIEKLKEVLPKEEGFAMDAFQQGNQAGEWSGDEWEDFFKQYKDE